MPTASLEAYYRAERAAGAERSEALSRALLWTADHHTASQRDALWTLAAQADPALADPHLRRASAALRHADVATALAAFGDAWQAMRLDAHEEARWLRQLVHALDVLVTATFVTLCALFMLRGLRLVRHAVGAAFGSRAAAFVAIVVPILCGAMIAPVLAAVVAATGSAPFLRRRECRTLAVVCAL